MDKIQIFDTTLRDGEQAAGSRLGAEEKLEIARRLLDLNVDVIEAGFPVSSEEDFRSVNIIAGKIKGPVICGLTRCVTTDIDRCGQALEPAERARIHTGIGISDIHIAAKFRDDKYGRTMEDKKNKIVEMAVSAVRRAGLWTKDIEFYAEDAARADRAYLFRVIGEVIEAGATVVNIPDTTGYAIPEEFGCLISDIRSRVKNIGRVVLSVHCHDDLGMATANTIAGIMNGCRQVECTVNGIGERAGNASLEEITAAIKVRRAYLAAYTDVNMKSIAGVSRLVSERMGVPISPNKAVVGTNAFSHSSGIHVDGFLKDPSTYEIIRPEDVGFEKSRIILTARSGRHAVSHRLEELGYRVPAGKIEEVYKEFLSEADRVKSVDDAAMKKIAAQLL